MAKIRLMWFLTVSSAPDEGFSDLDVRHASSDQGQHLGFPRREPVGEFVVASSRGGDGDLAERVHEPSLDRRVQRGIAAGAGLDRGGDLFATRILGEIPTCAARSATKTEASW